MGLDIHLHWEGFNDEDRQRVRDFKDGWTNPKEQGRLGHLIGWHWRQLLPECWFPISVANGWTVIPAQTLSDRLPEFLTKLRDEACQDDQNSEDYLEYCTGLDERFIERLLELEAEGKHPSVRASW